MRAQITKATSRRLASALSHAERAYRFVGRLDIAVGTLNTPATTTLHYTRPDGSTFYSIDKHIGTDLCGLEFCIDELRSILYGV